MALESMTLNRVLWVDIYSQTEKRANLNIYGRSRSTTLVVYLPLYFNGISLCVWAL